MTTPEADSPAELIADCAEIPAGLRTARDTIPGPRSAVNRPPDWAVDDTCVAQAARFDDYG